MPIPTTLSKLPFTFNVHIRLGHVVQLYECFLHTFYGNNRHTNAQGCNLQKQGGEKEREVAK